MSEAPMSVKEAGAERRLGARVRAPRGSCSLSFGAARRRPSELHQRADERRFICSPYGRRPPQAPSLRRNRAIREAPPAELLRSVSTFSPEWCARPRRDAPARPPPVNATESCTESSEDRSAIESRSCEVQSTEVAATASGAPQSAWATVLRAPMARLESAKPASLLVAEVVELALHVVHVDLCVLELALQIVDLVLNIVCLVVPASASGRHRRGEARLICGRHVPRLRHWRHISRLGRRHIAWLHDWRRSHTRGFGARRGVARLVGLRSRRTGHKQEHGGRGKKHERCPTLPRCCRCLFRVHWGFGPCRVGCGGGRSHGREGQPRKTGPIPSPSKSRGSPDTAGRPRLQRVPTSTSSGSSEGTSTEPQDRTTCLTVPDIAPIGMCVSWKAPAAES
jgi:hypothetical protein